MPLVEIDPRCEQCHQSLQQAGISIRKCGKCGIMNYCSVNCRTISWQASHKFECRKPEAANTEPRKTVSQLRLGSESDMSGREGSLDSQLYYVRVSRDWIDDIFIKGPFRQFEETFPHITRNLRFTRSGMEHFDELCRDGLMRRVIHIRAPLDADNNRKILIEIVLRSDSSLRERLPCPVYNVVCMMPVGKFGGIEDIPRRIRSMELVGSFVSEEEAEAAVRKETERYASHFAERRSIFSTVDGAFCGAVSQRGDIPYIFQMLHDLEETGITQQDDRSTATE